MNTQTKKIKRDRRKKRIRSKVFGFTSRPRISVFKSNKYITAQIIDDSVGNTLVQATSKNIKKGTGVEKALAVGLDLAQKALSKGIKSVVFDRSGYLYTGSVEALAKGARDGGLQF